MTADGVEVAKIGPPGTPRDFRSSRQRDDDAWPR
jgi:hypothetical protein